MDHLVLMTPEAEYYIYSGDVIYFAFCPSIILE